MGSCVGAQSANIPDIDTPPIERANHASAIPIETDSRWLDLQFHDKNQLEIKKPEELESKLNHPPHLKDSKLVDRILGSLFALAIGDALGAHVEFRPHQYLMENPVKDLCEGGTWGLKKGQFTDDTSMALCLASSLVASHGFSPYNQLVRYKWWYRHGYMSSTGACFDIGAGTRQSIRRFEERQTAFADQHQISHEKMDSLSEPAFTEEFNVYCSDEEAAGNGGLMRLCPVPLFFHRDPAKAVEYSGISGEITHGDRRVYDACRFYGALIVAALRGESKDDLLHPNFCQNHKDWFNNKPLHKDIQKIVEGSYKKKEAGYEDGIRGKGFVVNALEAALWAFCFDGNSFETGALAAVNLGDDTDTTAAIYGQLAGAYYGYRKLPQKWIQQVYARQFIACLGEWIAYEGERWFSSRSSTSKPSQPSSTTTLSPPNSVSEIPVHFEKPSKDKPLNKPHKQVPAGKPRK